MRCPKGAVGAPRTRRCPSSAVRPLVEDEDRRRLPKFEVDQASRDAPGGDVVSPGLPSGNSGVQQASDDHADQADQAEDRREHRGDLRVGHGSRTAESSTSSRRS
jgi:hypothetical protein